MRISVTASGNTVLFELNDSRAAKALYAQLPLTAEIADFSTNEQVFYPPDKLDPAETPLADAGKGPLAYYAPWGDVVMFYDRFGSGGGLYALGPVSYTHLDVYTRQVWDWISLATDSVFPAQAK